MAVWFPFRSRRSWWGRALNGSGWWEVRDPSPVDFAGLAAACSCQGAAVVLEFEAHTGPSQGVWVKPNPDCFAGVPGLGRTRYRTNRWSRHASHVRRASGSPIYRLRARDASTHFLLRAGGVVSCPQPDSSRGDRPPRQPGCKHRKQRRHTAPSADDYKHLPVGIGRQRQNRRSKSGRGNRVDLRALICVKVPKSPTSTLPNPSPFNSLAN